MPSTDFDLVCRHSLIRVAVPSADLDLYVQILFGQGESSVSCFKCLDCTFIGNKKGDTVFRQAFLKMYHPLTLALCEGMLQSEQLPHPLTLTFVRKRQSEWLCHSLILTSVCQCFSLRAASSFTDPNLLHRYPSVQVCRALTFIHVYNVLLSEQLHQPLTLMLRASIL